MLIGSIMNRREFLKISSGAALLMATTKFGVSKVLADDSKAPVGKNKFIFFYTEKTDGAQKSWQS